MIRRSALAAFAALLFTASAALADDKDAAKLSPMPNATEAKIVTAVQAELPKLYATTAMAEKAGYTRYTNEDSTGAISYANSKPWESTDLKYPAQLWYDVKGRLIGADYAALKATHPTAPSILGMQAGRDESFPAHIHYVTKSADGTMKYEQASRVKKYEDANGAGTSAKPTAEGLVKADAKNVKTASDVAFVFLFPAIWNVSVWVVHNPSGAFAAKNPNLKPSATADKDE